MTQRVFSFRTGFSSLAILIFALFLLSPLKYLADDANDSMPMPIGIGLIEPIQFPNVDTDIMGFRFNLLYGRNANVMGLDLGVLGCAVDGSIIGIQTSVFMNTVGSANGALQLSGIANNSIEDFLGLQLSGIINMSDEDVYGGQLSSINLARETYGLQIGVYNQAEKVYGIQIGVINYAKAMEGFQIGLVNIITEGPCPFLILFNASF